ncbi:hypothetical protein O3P69_018185 [Scylla paramamosain]|uniref:Uncharacterized protein n=1 Tax=Scylla paramamosain TaxID=85552 RepID=A0AAW0TLB5_SCYPA
MKMITSASPTVTLQPASQPVSMNHNSKNYMPFYRLSLSFRSIAATTVAKPRQARSTFSPSPPEREKVSPSVTPRKHSSPLSQSSSGEAQVEAGEVLPGVVTTRPASCSQEETRPKKLPRQVAAQISRKQVEGRMRVAAAGVAGLAWLGAQAKEVVNPAGGKEEKLVTRATCLACCAAPSHLRLASAGGALLRTPGWRMTFIEERQ